MTVSQKLFCLFAACAGLLSLQNPARADEKLTVGILPFSESLGAVIADKRGFFKEEGLEVEFSKFDSGALAIPVLQSGRINIVLSNIVSTIQVIERGLDVVLVAPAAHVRSTPPDTTIALLAPKGAFKSLKDLEGKRIGLNVINSATWLSVVADLVQHGVDYTKVKFVEIPFPQMNDPLLHDQIDAAVQVEPFRTALLATGKVEILSWPVVDTSPNLDNTQYIAVGDWVAKHHDAVAKFERAVVKGSKFEVTNDAETRDINQQFTNINPAFKDSVLLPLLSTEFHPVEMNHMMDMMKQYGLIKNSVGDLSARIFKE